MFYYICLNYTLNLIIESNGVDTMVLSYRYLPFKSNWVNGFDGVNFATTPFVTPNNKILKIYF